MTTFLFLMAKSSSRAQQARMLVELGERFPDRDFLLEDARFEEYECNIMAPMSGESLSPPEPDQLSSVIAFFRKTMRAVEDWKPS